MHLDARSLSILKQAYMEPQLSTTQIAEKNKLTKRQVEYSLQKINSWLESLNLKKITKNKKGHFLFDPKLGEYLNLPSSNNNIYILDEEERIIVTIIYLILKKEDISLEHIADKTEVSRNTASRDLREVEKFLEYFNLKVTYSRKIGFSIEGKEIYIRRLILNIISKFMEIPIYDEIFEEVTPKILLSVQEKVNQLEKELKIHYTDQSYSELPLQIILNNTRKNNQHKLDALLFDTSIENLRNLEEYKVVGEIFEMDNEENDNEQLWLTVQILTSNVRHANPKSKLIKNLDISINETLNLFEQTSFIKFVDREDLHRKLLIHMYPAYFRMLFGTNSIGDFEKEHLRINEELTQITKKAVKPIENLLGKEMPDNELFYISILFGGELMKQGVVLNKKLKAVVVCVNGVSISKLLKYSLSSMFPEILIVDSLSVREFYEYKKDYDIVFSTSNLETEKDLFIVSPIMSNTEKDFLRQRVNYQVSDSIIDINQSEQLNQIMKIVKEHVSPLDEQALEAEIAHILKGNNNIVDESHLDALPELSDYLNVNDIKIYDGSLEYAEAIKIGCVKIYV
ncbi:BglG family transcription antiterminator [Vagococcus fluvialis]|uniref:BglG family transcription antiterminator n=1 Tax=Vagococcus fluvialis TaxID=2738 RepID=UPI003B20C9A9